MKEQDKLEIISTVKSKLDPNKMRPLVEELGKIQGAIKDLVNKKEWTLEDCEQLYLYMNTRCHDATKMGCVEHRKAYASKTGVFAGREPCETCVFNQFCSYHYDNPWHVNMVKISDKLMDIYRFQKEITDDDKKFITSCYEEMIQDDGYTKLLNLIDTWDR